MATFKDIQNANEQIKTTDIKGKDYAEVNQRIKAFRMVYPMGYIDTEIVSIESGVCIIRAEVGVTLESGDKFSLGSGTAYEKENSSYINKTSYIENCETSAVGRALGMAGFGIDTSVASYEEVQNAITQQEAEKPMTKQQRLTIETLCGETGNDIPDMANWNSGKADKAIQKLMSLRAKK